MGRSPIVAIMYDFDKTLSMTDMQNYSFIPNLDMTPEEFWGNTSVFSEKTGVERILSYMYMMIAEAKKKGIKLTKEYLKECGKNIKYFDPELNESYVPYVIETSIGVDRMFLSVLCSSYEEQKLEGGDTRVVLHLPAPLAPVKCAVMPLVRKDGLPEKAREIVNSLKFDFATHYEEKDSIGKRYRRQDAIGTPFCITVDHQTLEDGTVTLRERDSMTQSRVAIADLHKLIHDNVSLNALLRKLG